MTAPLIYNICCNPECYNKPKRVWEKHYGSIIVEIALCYACSEKAKEFFPS